MNSRHRQLFASLLLAGFGAAALAQGAPATSAPGTPPRAEMREHHGPRDGAAMHQRMEEHFAKRQAMLKQKLAITPQQEGAWNAWTAAVKPAPRNAQQRPDRAAFERMTTPERIDRMRAMRAERQAHMDARANATKVFYAALTPEQQKTFDQVSMRMMGGHRGGHRGHHG